MKNRRVAEGIVNQLLYPKKEFIDDQLPAHIEDRLAGAGETVDKIPASVLDQLSAKKSERIKEFDIPIKKVVRHLHYKIEMNNSKSQIYFSVFYAFFNRGNISKIKHWIAKKVEIARKNNSSIQMMYVSRDTGNLVISQSISIQNETKKELKEKISLLLEEIETYWPFKY